VVQSEREIAKISFKKITCHLERTPTQRTKSKDLRLSVFTLNFQLPFSVRQGIATTFT
jgi:hypothetical protein